MPRLFIVNVDNDNITIDEVNEDGLVLESVHNTDVTRFIDQNNVKVETQEKKAPKKFKQTEITVPDDDILETYKMTIFRHTSGSVNDITYDD